MPLPGKPMSEHMCQLIARLLWGIVACCFGLLGFPGTRRDARLGQAAALPRGASLPTALLGLHAVGQTISARPGDIRIIEPNTTPSHAAPRPSQGPDKMSIN